MTPRIARQPLGAAMLVLCACLSAGAASAEDAVTRANRMAYDMAIKCFVADSLASDERHDAGDEAGATTYRDNARHSFDVAYSAGGKLSMTDRQVGRDLDFAQGTELPRMMRDRRYFLSTASTCKAIDLMQP